MRRVCAKEERKEWTLTEVVLVLSCGHGGRECRVVWGAAGGVRGASRGAGAEAVEARRGDGGGRVRAAVGSARVRGVRAGPPASAPPPPPPPALLFSRAAYAIEDVSRHA